MFFFDLIKWVETVGLPDHANNQFLRPGQLPVGRVSHVPSICDGLPRHILRLQLQTPYSLSTSSGKPHAFLIPTIWFRTTHAPHDTLVVEPPKYSYLPPNYATRTGQVAGVWFYCFFPFSWVFLYIHFKFILWVRSMQNTLSNGGSWVKFVSLVGCGQHFHISQEFELVGAIKSTLVRWGVVEIVRHVRHAHRGS